ncbi:MAG TPA: hypothetical protein VHX38_28575 [Pseudonocardiaceae bacterium]|jgi:hypothetical protein|nr:hypothetical protein [Pseudonocardiaceae bacterium]
MEVGRVVRRRAVNGTDSTFGSAPEQIPIPKLTGGNSNLRRSRRRKPPGKVVITIGVLSFVFCLVLAIGEFVSTTEELPYRAGWAGTPGTVSSVSCQTEGSGRDEYTLCEGVFRTDSPAQPMLVSIEGDSTYASDRGYPARLHSDGQTVSVVGGKAVVYILGGMLAILGFVVFLGGMMLIAIVGFAIRRRRGRRWQPSKRIVLAPMITGGVLLGFGIIGGVVGAALGI